MKFIISIINIFFLNIIFFYISKIKKKKTIIFYHPNQNLILIHSKFIEKLLHNKNYYCVYLHQNFFLKKKKYFFLINYFCKLLFNVDLFISNNVCDYFSNFSKKIYIHHDIYDTPLVEKDKLDNLKKRLKVYDYIFLASKSTKIIFNKLFEGEKYRPGISVIGYFKLDYLLKYRIKKKITSIVIAPTNFLAFRKFSLYDKLNKIINILLNKTNYNIVFRPHPSNLYSKKVIRIVKTFKKNKKFILDSSRNYSESYSNSICLITDLSGTAYTYALFTKRPVIFFRNYNKKLEKSYENLNYFKDRYKIGQIYDDVSQFKFISKVLKNKNFYKKNIKIIMKNNFNIGNTKKNFWSRIKTL